MSARPIKAATWEKFLAAIEEGLPIYKACKVSGVSYVRQWQERKSNPEFAKRFDEVYDIGRAIDTDALLAEARKRAFAGSDSLLMFLIKQRDPSFRERFSAELTGKDGGPITTETSVKSIDPALLKAARDGVIGEF